MDVEYIVDRLIGCRILIRMIIWLRGLLWENKIPDTLLDKLKTYVPELSEKILDIETINERLMIDINHLNNREELESLKSESNIIKSHRTPFYRIRGSRKKKAIKYKNVRIVRYYDIIEFYEIIDRFFVIYIDMEDSKGFNSYWKKYAAGQEEAFYYNIRLSTLKSIF